MKNSPYSNRKVAPKHLGLLRGLQMLSKQLEHLTSKSCKSFDDCNTAPCSTAHNQHRRAATVIIALGCTAAALCVCSKLSCKHAAVRAVQQLSYICTAVTAVKYGVLCAMSCSNQ
eukprot:9332-Heterococcus_DN1.PRE.4